MKNRRIEIGIIIMFIITTTFIIFIGEAYLSHFKQSEILKKTDFNNLIKWSVTKAFIIDIGLISLFYINRNRINKGKKKI
ncbi:hypothetical protein BWZ22_15730 [Seonamhaeicola sp. S2-3]|uniref:hypothetical protein n=1 Tax=Seonamhaeicola sp. S2-3 TaxID=1936081 RepID=UPI000972E8A5|nr:hypothetical protein [Seonamhaeicola sp. S2-3]APY12580.1 hypothetical protein BWZ22_15730 [Seonamhaeicola sp. S2-3]